MESRFRWTQTLTFLLGLGLALFAFIGVILYVNAQKPATYSVLVAAADINPGEPLPQTKLRVDRMVMHPKVVARLVREEELENYLGKIVVETIYAGEPIRKHAIVSEGNPAAQSHLSRGLERVGEAAFALPANKVVIPDGIYPGDCIDLVVGFGTLGTLSQFEEQPPEQVRFPLAKAIVKAAPVLQVVREKEPNPEYGAVTGAPPYVEGKVQNIVVRIPREAEEPLKFALDQGTVHVIVLSPQACQELPSPTLGFTLDDFKAFFQEERKKALGLVEPTPTLALSPTLTVTVTVTTPTPAATVETPSPTPTPTPPAPQASLPMMSLVLPCFGSVFLLLLVGLAFLMGRRRR